MPNITVIYNQAAGSIGQLDKLKQAFERSHITANFIALNKSIKSDIDAAIADGTSIVVAAGGDGTVNAVASCLVDTEVALGIIPAGTLNHFAKDLGIPMDFAAAAKVLVQGQIKSVDVGTVHDQVFLNNSSLGLYPEVVRRRDGRFSKFGKWPALMIGTISVITRLKRYRLEICIDNKPIRKCVTPFVFVGNNKYDIEKLGLFKRHHLTKGKLCLYILKSHSLISLVWLVLRSLFGRSLREHELEAIECKSVEVNASKSKLSVALDGELTTLATPLCYRSKSAALKVIM